MLLGLIKIPYRRTGMEDYDRIAENMLKNYGDRIRNQKDYEYFFEEYMNGEDINSIESLKYKSWRYYEERAGDSLRAKRNKQEQERYRREQQQKKRITRRARKRQIPSTTTTIIRKKEEPKRKYTFTGFGRVKGRIVEVRPIHIKIRGKKTVRWIDKKGRYASIKQKKKSS